MFAVNAQALLSGSFSSSVATDAREGVTNLSDLHQLTRPTAPIEHLPRELLLRIFTLVIEADNGDLRWIRTFSLVCRRWCALCYHPLLWEFVAKRIFVAYPLVARLRSAPWDPQSQIIVNKMRMLGAEEHLIQQHDPLQPLPAPTKSTVLRELTKVRRHKERQAHYKYVQRKRSLVLHTFLSLTLLFTSLALASILILAEDLVPSGLHLDRNTPFNFLWLAYLCITGIIVSNVVMQTHFEPQPLLLRLTRNKFLITLSCLTMTLGITDIIVPTILVQVNLSRTERFSWLWCGATNMLSFCLWQCYTLFCIMPDARRHFYQQMNEINIREGFQFVAVNVPNAFPILFAGAAFCAFQYVQQQNRLYVVLGGVPIIVTLVVLGLVFLLDFLSFHRSKDLCVGMCLLTAALFPLSLLMWDFRGWCLLPLVLSSFGFYLAHAKFVATKAFHEFLKRRDELPVGQSEPPTLTSCS